MVADVGGELCYRGTASGLTSFLERINKPVSLNSFYSSETLRACAQLEWSPTA